MFASRKECASLCYRFHDAGWCHGSVAARNTVVQRGPLSARPTFRGGPGTKDEGKQSFRLIDFGRSEKKRWVHPLDEEKREVRYLFKHMPPWTDI